MFVPEYKTFGEFVVKDMSKNAKVTLKVSNKKIASAKWDKRQNIVWVTAKKPGTVKVTLKIVQNKKTYTYTSKMTWVKYNNPLKSLSVGKTKYKVSYFDKNTTAAMKKVKGSQTLKVSLKKGYKLKILQYPVVENIPQYKMVRRSISPKKVRIIRLYLLAIRIRKEITEHSDCLQINPIMNGNIK